MRLCYEDSEPRTEASALALRADTYGVSIASALKVSKTNRASIFVSQVPQQVEETAGHKSAFIARPVLRCCLPMVFKIISAWEVVVADIADVVGR